MKGQYFILGAILICSMFFIGLPPIQPIREMPSEDMDYIMKNLEHELPHALNLGLGDGTPRQTMENFTGWVRGFTRRLLINLSSTWVFAMGNEYGDVTVSVGNFMGTDMIVSVDLDGDQRNIFVQDGDSESTTYTSVGSVYDLSIQFGSESRSFSWNRDKANLFAIIELERGENIARKDIVA